MSKAPLLSQLTHLYLRKKHNHFHACCAAKIFLVVMSKGFNVLFVYNKTILETSSEILSNMVKSSTVLDKSQPFVHTFNVSSKDVGKSPNFFCRDSNMYIYRNKNPSFTFGSLRATFSLKCS